MALAVDNAGRVAATPSGTSMPPELARLIAGQMAAGTPGNPTGIYLDISLDGKGPTTKQVRLEGKGWKTVQTGNGRRFNTLEEAVNSFYMLDEDYREKLQEQMWWLGLIDGPNNTLQAVSAWGKAVELAWNFKAAGKDASPFEMLQKMTNLKAGQLGPGLKGPAARTVTQRQINFTDPEQAKAWIRSAFQQSMGRDPHDAEIRAMLSGIADGNRKDQQVIQTTTDIDGNTTQEVIDPGFDPQAFIANRMSEDPEGAAYQAASTLYPALIQALASPV